MGSSDDADLRGCPPNEIASRLTTEQIGQIVGDSRPLKPYYEAGGVTLYHGDCLEVLPLLAERFDLVFTSPPYNLGGASNACLAATHRKIKWRAPALGLGYGAHDDAMAQDDYVAWQHRVLLRCWDLLGPSGAIFYNHKPIIRDGLIRTPLDLNPGLPLRQIVTWWRGSGLNFSHRFYVPECEWIVVLAGDGFALKDKPASGVSDLWRFPPEVNSDHPAPFPLALPARAIETTGARSVLDPFAGSGTTLLAAKRAGARAVGIEIEERFCEMAARRLDQGVLPLFDEAAS